MLKLNMSNPQLLIFAHTEPISALSSNYASTVGGILKGSKNQPFPVGRCWKSITRASEVLILGAAGVEDRELTASATRI